MTNLNNELNLLEKREKKNDVIADMESAHKKFIDSALVKHMDLPSARVEDSQKSKTIHIEIESDESETIVEKFDVGTTPVSEFKSV